MVKKVYIAEPRGFCAGVEMAIKSLSFLVRTFRPPIYCYHEIVHNQTVVNRFKLQGVIFVDSIDEVPKDAVVMLSAHGSAPSVVNESQQQNRLSINAVCPLVTKVHHEAKTRAKKGYEIIYIGHKNHDEAIGTMAVAPDNIHLVTNEEELKQATSKISKDKPVALLAQTTLAMSEWEGLANLAHEDFQDIWTAGKSDLCFATTNRQGALKELSQHSDVLIIVGSSNSSNTLALEKVARQTGLERVYRIDSVEQIEQCKLKEDDIVGITAGASAPEDVVQKIVKACNAKEGVVPLAVINEEEYFPPPSQLRELAINLNYAFETIFSTRRKDPIENIEVSKVFGSDRSYPASAALEHAGQSN